ncbi:MAG: winged helix-turn-helix domain-containing protein, partial [Chloroflexota bacterium]
MSVPNYQAFMLPLLKIANDQETHTIGESVETLATQFNLSDEERNELVPGGTETRLRNRVKWARTYLQKAGVLEPAGRSAFRVTKRGTEVLAANPTTIDSKYLERYEEFREFKGLSKIPTKPTVTETPEPELTPEEILDVNHRPIYTARFRLGVYHFGELGQSSIRVFRVPLMASFGLPG